MEEKIIVVDQNDLELFHLPKLEAHQKGVLHRAVSIFIFNSNQEILLQKRASSKYHSGGLWSNTCCSHPRPGEDTDVAAHRRLKEEMGLKAKLTKAFTFQYKALLGGGLIENELDHVFVGFSDSLPKLNPKEVEDYKYLTPKRLQLAFKKNSNDYTIWLKNCFNELMNYMSKNNSYAKII